MISMLSMYMARYIWFETFLCVSETMRFFEG